MSKIINLWRFIVLIAFVCCAVLNLMAALIPAWTALRKPIVESLNQKK